MTGEGDALRDYAALIAALRDPAAYPHAVGSVEVIETHISTVLLAGDHAYKIKKPVDLGFADFSTLARRQEACNAEIRLNRRTAPEMYLGVVPVTRTERRPRFGGDGEPVEYAVHMRRFANGARFDELAQAGKLDDNCIDGLAATIAAFHAACPRAPAQSAYGTPEQIGGWMRDTVSGLRLLVESQQLLDQKPRIERLARWTELEFARRRQVFAARRASGRVRECHGDLHLANVAKIEGRPVPFDCIEFNPELRFIDVMSDVAFAWMDLHDHDLPHLAARFLDRYLEGTGDYEGLAVLRFYAVYRALVRALVAMIRRGQPDRSAADRARDKQACVRYVDVAERLFRVRAPLFLLTCGVTGSGKTTVAQHLLERLGAVRVRSDVERKRRAGLASTDHRPQDLEAGLYDAAATRATYEALAAAAAAIVDAGFCAIVDATFQRRADRQAFAALAAEHGACRAVVVCEAGAPTLRARVAARSARGDDASDATLAVLADQLAHFEQPTADEGAVYRIDTDADAPTIAARCLELAGALAADAVHPKPGQASPTACATA
ncbi:MAG TPA: AAA family ATPase [Burkholderiaceae bacterium]|nr:AAA family ATPase [Burkholderiaceae bacterium]